MGGLVDSIFGGSSNSSSSSSSNQAYPALSSALTGNIGLGNSAMSALGSLLGIGDPAAGQTALKNFNNSTGMNFLLDTGSKAITGNMASRGLLNSGATGKALTNYGQQLGQTQLSNLMSQLTSLGNYGLGSAGVLGSAGQTSTSSSKGSSSNGVFNSLFPGGSGAGLAGAITLLSDRRLKTNITRIGANDQGIPIYHFAYKDQPHVMHTGVLADEVARYLPEALGPEYDGYMTVDYSKITPLPDFPFSGIAVEDDNA